VTARTHRSGRPSRYSKPGNVRLTGQVDRRVSKLIPGDYAALLDRPLDGHLATIRPDDTVQVNPMWFEFDGEHLRFTHTYFDRQRWL